MNADGQDSAALPPGNLNSGANSNKGFPSEGVYKSGPTSNPKNKNFSIVSLHAVYSCHV